MLWWYRILFDYQAILWNRIVVSVTGIDIAILSMLKYIFCRWWVASHATNHTNLTVGKNILDQCKESVQKVRAVLRFLLASLGDYQPCEHSLAVADLKPMDQYMLHLLKGHIERVSRGVCLWKRGIFLGHLVWERFKDNLSCLSL